MRSSRGEGSTAADPAWLTRPPAAESKGSSREEGRGSLRLTRPPAAESKGSSREEGRGSLRLKSRSIRRRDSFPQRPETLSSRLASGPDLRTTHEQEHLREDHRSRDPRQDRLRG